MESEQTQTNGAAVTSEPAVPLLTESEQIQLDNAAAVTSEPAIVGCEAPPPAAESKLAASGSLKRKLPDPDEVEFVDPEVAAELACSICQQVARMPHRTVCGHVFCAECIRHSASYKDACPDCRRVYPRPEFDRTLNEISMKLMVKTRDGDSIRLRQFISEREKARVYSCSGCGVKLSADPLRAHHAECPDVKKKASAISKRAVRRGPHFWGKESTLWTTRAFPVLDPGDMDYAGSSIQTELVGDGNLKLSVRSSDSSEEDGDGSLLQGFFSFWLHEASSRKWDKTFIRVAQFPFSGTSAFCTRKLDDIRAAAAHAGWERFAFSAQFFEVADA